MSVKTLIFSFLSCSLSMATFSQTTLVRVTTPTLSKTTTIAYLQILDPHTNTYTNIDSASIKKGTFHFKVNNPTKSIASFTLEGQKNIFVLDQTDVKGFVNPEKSWENNFTPDKENRLLTELLSNLASETNKIQEYREHNGKLFETAVQESNYAQIDSLQKHFTTTWNTYLSKIDASIDKQIKEYPNSMAALFIVYQQLQADNLDIGKASTYYASLSRQAKASSIGKAIDTLIQQKSSSSASSTIEALDQLSVELIDNQFWNAKQNTSELTLFHFWASWCDACQQRIQTLKEFHQKNKDNSLNIISISVDLKDRELQDFIEEQDYDWLHAKNIEDLVKVFNPTSIPSIYAVDKNGKIIAENHLEPQQMQLLQDYLDNKSK